MEGIEKFPVHQACMEGKDKQALDLIDIHPQLVNKLDEDGRLPLHWAVSAGNLGLAQTLAERAGSKFDVDAVDSVGWSPLHIACGLGERGEDLVKWLVGRDADVNLKNNNGQTPIHLAASKQSIPTIRYLLEHGAKANLKDKRQQATPLIRAASVGALPVVRLLLEHKSPVNATDVDGWTALHHAIAEGNGDVALELLKNGADPKKESREGELPLSLAPDEKVKAWIKDAAAKEGIEI